MIAYFLFFVLLALSFRCFAWGLLRPDRLYQFPTLFGAAWLFYIIPQASGAVNNPDKYPEWVLGDGGLQLALLMCILCVQAGWSGYHNRRSANPSSPPLAEAPRYSDSRLFTSAAALYAVGLYAAYLLASLAGGFVDQFTGGGHYELEWSGLPVRYVFFAQFIYPALAIAWLAYLRRPTSVRAAFLALFSIYPIATTIFLGRRASTVFLLLIVFLGLFFVRRWAPPRPVMLAGVVLMALFVALAPQYRTVTQYGFDMEQLREVQVKSSLADILSGKAYAEFDALVVTIASYDRDKEFGFGSGFYNATIGQLVPRQLVGEEIKSGLMLDLWGDTWRAGLLSSEIPYGSNPTGVANAFVEFWFFGAAIYYLFAAGVRRLWERAAGNHSLGAQVWYVLIASFIPISVLGSLTVLPGELIAMYVFIAPILWYSRFRGTNRVPVFG